MTAAPPVVVVTASTAGIGLEIACQFAAAGAQAVVLNGRHAESGQRAVETVKQRASGCEVLFCAADVGDGGPGVAQVAREAVTHFKRIDVLVNCLGGGLTPRPFSEIPSEQFDVLAERHLLSVMRACHEVLPHMIKQGSGTILNLSSDAGKLATPGETVVGAMKAGVIMFSRTLAMEAARHGVRVHCLTPSIVQGTSTYQKLMSDPFSAKLFQKAERRAALGVTRPADVAALAVFLASPAAANMTGQAISVNGGISAA